MGDNGIDKESIERLIASIREMNEAIAGVISRFEEFIRTFEEANKADSLDVWPPYDH